MTAVVPDLIQTPCFAVIEDTLSSSRELQLFHGLKELLCVTDPGQIDAALARIEEAGKCGLWVVLAASYELGLSFEPKLFARQTNDIRLLQAWFFNTRHVMCGDAIDDFWQKQLIELSPQQKEAGLLSLKPSWSEATYVKAVDKIQELITEGDCYQVNLTMPMDGEIYGHPISLYTRLRELQPVKYSTLIHSEDDWILSLSPELFVERRGQTLVCRPMKGTAKRCSDSNSDRSQAEAQLASEKNRAENLMIVDLIRNDLGKLAPVGGVKTTAMFEVESYRTLHQLTSTIQATPVTHSLASILKALFPCGSITGAPKIRAMEIIAELEDEPRGIYCGALGWLSPHGDFRLSVPIRTLAVSKNRQCRLNIGSGIVADSSPKEEYLECILKARFASILTEEVQLIETLRWEPGVGYPLLDQHLKRLLQSAISLGFTCNTGRIQEELHNLAKTLKPTTHRVRGLLWKDGRFDVAATPLDPLHSRQTVCFSRQLLDPVDPRLRYKTTARHFYDQALRVAMALGHFDVLHFNTRNELCEGARSNIFVEREGMLLTPPQSSGLLPGVLRAHLLATGKAKEAILVAQDILDSDKLWVGNALRGLIHVSVEAIALP